MTVRVPLSHYPGFNRFVLDWLAGEAQATQFLPRQSGTQTLRAPGPAARRSPELAGALAEFNRGFGIFVKPQLERWAAGETVTLVAGQQAGFAGGPLYTLAKIASMLRIKRDLEKAGQAVTAFFWLATEDHDLEEVAQLSVPVPALPGDTRRQLDLLTLRAAGAADSRAPVGRVPIPEPLIVELLALYELARPSWLREGVTFGQSFAELIAPIVGSEVILIDSLQPELRREGGPLFERILNRWSDLEQAIGKRSNALVAAGYTPQVVPRQGETYSLLFELDDQFRRRLITGPSGRRIDPERVSTSALTRPLLQDAVLQPDVFIGGPAEVAYYAQITPCHDLLDVPMPKVALRGHTLVAPRRVVRLIERYAISPGELFCSADELLAVREPEGVAAIRSESAAAQKELLAHIERIGELALPADHALARAFSRSIGHLEYHFNKLTERAIRGLVRKDKERHAALAELLATLYPDHRVQDRVVGWFPYWLRYGSRLTEQMITEILPDSESFNILAL